MKRKNSKSSLYHLTEKRRSPCRLNLQLIVAFPVTSSRSGTRSSWISKQIATGTEKKNRIGPVKRRKWPCNCSRTPCFFRRGTKTLYFIVIVMALDGNKNRAAPISTWSEKIKSCTMGESSQICRHLPIKDLDLIKALEMLLHQEIKSWNVFREFLSVSQKVYEWGTRKRLTFPDISRQNIARKKFIPYKNTINPILKPSSMRYVCDGKLDPATVGWNLLRIPSLFTVKIKFSKWHFLGSLSKHGNVLLKYCGLL